MAYVIETITPEDQRRILKDAECDPIKVRNLNYAVTKAHNFPERWVIDRERDYYMFIPPQMVWSDNFLVSPRYFFFNGFMYEFLAPIFVGSDVEFVDQPPELQRESFHDEITAAFAVAGRGMVGPLNEFGDPEYAFVPVFVEKKEG